MVTHDHPKDIGLVEVVEPYVGGIGMGSIHHHREVILPEDDAFAGIHILELRLFDDHIECFGAPDDAEICFTADERGLRAV